MKNLLLNFCLILSIPIFASIEEAEIIGKKIENSFYRKGESNLLDTLIEYDSILDQFIYWEKGFISANFDFQEMVKTKFPYGKQIKKRALHFDFIRAYQFGTNYNLIFREIKSDQSLNYIELHLNDKYTVQDIMDYQLGQYYSFSLKNAYQYMQFQLQEKNDSIALEIDTLLMRDFRLQIQLDEQIAQKEYQEALKTLKSFKSPIKNDLYLYLSRLEVLSHIDKKQFYEYAKSKPHFFHSKVSLFKIVNLSNDLGNYDMAYLCLKGLTEHFDNDPYLNLLLANISLNAGDYDISDLSSKLFLDNFPDQLIAYFIRLNALIVLNRMDECIQTIETMQIQFKFSKAQTHEYLQGYQYLILSTEYQNWINH